MANATRWPREMKYDNVVDETYDKIYKLYKKWNPYSELNEEGVKLVKDILRDWAETDYETTSDSKTIFTISDFNEKIRKVLFPHPIVNCELRNVLEPKFIDEFDEKMNEFRSQIQRKLFGKVYPEISEIEFKTSWNKKTFWLEYKFNETRVELCGTNTSQNIRSMVSYPDREDIYLTVNGKDYKGKLAEFETTPEGKPLYQLIEKYGDVDSTCRIEI